MNKMEYAEAIANELGGMVEVREKANGVKVTGVTVKDKDRKISPLVYIDQLYDNGYSVEEATEKVRESMKENAIDMPIDTNDLMDWNWAKERIETRLYNESTNADVRISADVYGFSDLVLIPYVKVMENGSVKVTNDLLDKWGVSPMEVINTGLDNVDYEIKNFFGMPIVTNTRQAFGASSVIKAEKELKELNPDGYVVIPSSVHEVIVLPLMEGVKREELVDLVKQVNASEVSEEERLSDNVYFF